jgi:osomolarity two-component system, sensor histidine kinase SLN1
MGEDDLPRIKRSLQVVYKSGDLLLHLLNDLLTFSKNQIGQQLSLEEKEFRLADIKTQIITIFMKQVKEGKIDFSVKFISTDTEGTSSVPSEKVLPALGPSGSGRLKDMWYVPSIVTAPSHTFYRPIEIRASY